MKTATITNIDLPLFKRQRETLYKILINPKGYNLKEQQVDHLDGILNLTDVIYDKLLAKPKKPKKHKCGANLEAKELFYGHCLACGEDIK